jgi:glycosidase
MNRLLSLFILIFLAYSCQTNLKEKDSQDTMIQDENYLSEGDKNDKVVVYQIMTRLFGNTKSLNKIHGTAAENGVGKFNDINDKALKAIKDMGITHVWYTGIIEHAVIADYSQDGVALDDPDVVKGRAGSPYAIKDYYDVNPDLAVDVPNRMKEFEALVERTHKNGMKVIIDFIPNHVARNYVSDAKPEGVRDIGQDDDTSKAFLPSNNYYYIPGEDFVVPEGYVPLGGDTNRFKDGKFKESPAKATGNDVFSARPTIGDWFETVKLNYGVDYLNNRQKHFDPIPDTWIKMRDILVYWAGKKVDGFRCDMAEMVPVEFWNWMIPQLKEVNPEIIFIAEIYNPNEYRNYIENGKFDFLYDKVELYDTLKNIVQERGMTDWISGIWKAHRGINKNMLTFLENHDEQRLASPFFAGNMHKGNPAMLISATLTTAPVMVYFGQEVGEPAKGASGFSDDDGRTTIFDYWGVPEHQKWVNNGKFDGGLLSEEQKELRNFYSRLLNLSHRKAIAHGDLYDIHPFNRYHDSRGVNEKVYTYLRFTENEKFLVIANFGTQPIDDFQLVINEEALEKMQLNIADNLKIKELLANQKGEFTLTKASVRPDKNDKEFTMSLAPLATHIFEISK